MGPGGSVFFGLLGLLLVRVDGTEVVVAAGRQRVMFAALLARAGRPVSSDELIDLVWDGAPPDGAAPPLCAPT